MWKERDIERKSELKLRGGGEKQDGDDDDDDDGHSRNWSSNEVNVSRKMPDGDSGASPDDDMREWLASKHVRGRGSIGFQGQR